MERFVLGLVTGGQPEPGTAWRKRMEGEDMLGTILLVLLILLLIGAIPSWPYSRNWGYGPSGGLGLLVVIIIILLVMGRI
jgi:asparagine N-glycosylation enzyme membrane subunit Stt3